MSSSILQGVPGTTVKEEDLFLVLAVKGLLLVQQQRGHALKGKIVHFKDFVVILA